MTNHVSADTKPLSVRDAAAFIRNECGAFPPYRESDLQAAVDVLVAGTTPADVFRALFDAAGNIPDAPSPVHRLKTPGFDELVTALEAARPYREAMRNE